MPRPHEFLIRDTDTRDALVAAVANIVHAAGVTVALSLETAQKIVSTSETFFFGEPGEVKTAAAANCLHLREIRRHKRQKRAKTRKTAQAATAARPVKPAEKTIWATHEAAISRTAAPTDTASAASEAKQAPANPASAASEAKQADHGDFATWLVWLRAELETRIGASTPEAAISIAARDLPKHLTSAHATKEKHL